MTLPIGRFFLQEVPGEQIDDGIPLTKKEVLDELIAGITEAFRILGAGEIADSDEGGEAAGNFADPIMGMPSDECASLASEYLRKNVYGRDYLPVTVASTGHTHIDVAWKWQLRQTREKAIRSYSTVMELMKRYPEYRFMMSTPQLYEFIREDEPELFEKILEKVKEGWFGLTKNAMFYLTYHKNRVDNALN